MQTAVLVLAAGSSSRMGQSKQLLEINGVPLLVHAVKEGLAVTPNVVVVLGSDFELHQLALQGLSVTIVQNKSWRKGMGSSLKEGITHLLEAKPKIDAIIVMVCDQPKLLAIHLQKLIAKGSETKKTIVASTYAGTAGVPALFKKEQFDELLNTDDDMGARKVIRQNSEAVTTVDFPGGIIDLDTREEYNQFIRENFHGPDTP